MASIQPARFLRPTPAEAAAISSPPYDVVDSAEARALLQSEPGSFMSVLRPEANFAPDAVPDLAAQNSEAKRRFEEMLATGRMVKDAAPRFYLYRLTHGDHSQTGLVASCAVDDYDKDRIKKHEHVQPAKVEDRTDQFLALGAQTGPIFLAYSSSEESRRVLAEVESRCLKKGPLYDFKAGLVQHSVYEVDQDHDAIVAAFAAIPAIYIADGHHRTASACNVRNARQAEAGDPSHRFLAVVFPEESLAILPYNRLVTELGGVDLRARILERFGATALEQAEPSPSRKGLVSFYVEGSWTTIDIAAAYGSSASQQFDAYALQTAVFDELLGIADPKRDKRLRFVGGDRGPEALAALVDSGECAAAFSLFPVAMRDVIAVSDAGEVLPPKSTWFEPKLRSGLFVYDLDGREL